MRSRDAGLFAIGAGFGVGISILAYKYSTKVQSKSHRIDANFQSSEGGASASTVTAEDFDKDDILNEQLTRNIQFFGLEGQRKISKSFVVVVGLGVRVLGCTVDHILNSFSILLLALLAYLLLTTNGSCAIAGSWQSCCTYVAKSGDWEASARRF